MRTIDGYRAALVVPLVAAIAGVAVTLPGLSLRAAPEPECAS